MDFTSSIYLAFVALIILAFNAWSSPRYRAWVLVIANLVFVASFVQSPEQLAPLSGFLVLGYAAARWVARWPKPWISGPTVAMIVAVFVVLKRYTFLPAGIGLPFLYLQIGLSYILFRILQMVIDSAGGEKDARLGPLNFCNFTCNFLSFVSGPIQRSDEYLVQLGRLGRKVDETLAFKALHRIIKGFIKLAVVSAVANYLFAALSAAVLAETTPLSGLRYTVQYAASAVAYTFYLYYNFSGYMDIVIGIGWLLGQDLPENFDRPFSARNIFEFWARWHMTLSEWFKTYLFNPLMKLLADHVPAPPLLPYLGVVAFFVTFFVMGVWHGSTGVFVIYGLVMGAGASLNKLWQVFMIKRLGKKRYKSVGESFAYASLARGLLFAFFALAVTGLWVDMHQLSLLQQRLGVAGFALALVATALSAALGGMVVDRAGRALGALAPRLLVVNAAGVAARNVVLAGEVLLIFAVSAYFHKAPEFVYKAF
ncbi:MAG TPA: MBOAT family O-acyltransferase [Steroidobacteraceae bacterium]|jgi:D-alanyl-lipoteichoic acid acyltransferase DltB (MBOAT superfamily)|nr:MBOAT family O-acyltransferase [Steroidobacteraceae bacterium]